MRAILYGAAAMIFGFLIAEVAKGVHPQLGLLVFLVGFLALAIWEVK